jgi:hypothetical protein
MLRSGQHIEPATLTAVIDAAWGTGVVLLQQYAQQLHERGRQQGLFPLTVTQQVCSEGCVLALQLPGGPAHVVQLSLLGLLAQLREQAGTLLSPLIEGSGCAKVLLRLPVQVSVECWVGIAPACLLGLDHDWPTRTRTNTPRARARRDRTPARCATSLPPSCPAWPPPL